jgi:hypothetical protein
MESTLSSLQQVYAADDAQALFEELEGTEGAKLEGEIYLGADEDLKACQIGSFKAFTGSKLSENILSDGSKELTQTVQKTSPVVSITTIV